MNKTKKVLSMVLALSLSVSCASSLLAACGKKDDGKDDKSYTYLDSFITTPNTWNPHTYRTTDDSYPLDFTSSGLYEFFFNEDKTGYEIEPVMAAAEPVDVTEELKSVAKWEIPADATKGYAYKIALNPNAKWDDGTPINADTYVESMKLLLDPNYANYRASGYYTGDLVYKNAEAYAFSGLHAYSTPVITASGSNFVGYFNMPGLEDTSGNVAAGAPTLSYDEDGKAWVDGKDLAINLHATSSWSSNNSLEDYYTLGYETSFWSDSYISWGYTDADGAEVWLDEEDSATVVAKYYYTAEGADPVEVFLNAAGDGYEFADGTALSEDEAKLVSRTRYFGEIVIDIGGKYALPEDGIDYFQELVKLENAKGEVVMTETAIGYLNCIIAGLQLGGAGYTIEEYAAARDAASGDGTYAYLEWQEFAFYGSDYDTIDFADVGMYKSGEYEITIVLEKSLSGFYLLYNLAGNWIVHVDSYKDSYTQDPITGLWNSTYNTSVATAHSYGPYKITKFEEDKLMEFERNENWFGYSDDRFDGLYQTTKIRATWVQEASTRKDMFMKGELMTYGLQAEDYADYRTSDFFYTSPGTTIFFLVLYGNETQLKLSETAGVNKTILANPNFREALSVCFDKDAFAAKISPARSGAFSVIGGQDIWNPTTGETYRSTTIAKEALVDYYGFTKNADGTYSATGSDLAYTLDQAVDAITGYNPEHAKAKFLEAFAEWEEAGKYNKGDVVEITYALSADSDFMTKTIAELNAKIDAVLAGTDYAGKVKIVKSAPLGDDWSSALREGRVQTCLCGWNGGMLNPFGTMLYYTEPSFDPYAEEWWNTAEEYLTIELPVGEDGALVEIEMSIAEWALCLNGDVISVEGEDYNFGYEQVADEVRLTIMAEIEKAILATNYYIPLLQDGSGFLLTKKANYVLGPEDYNAVLGRGGIMYMTYNYTDAEWDEYVKSCGGTIDYK